MSTPQNVKNIPLIIHIKGLSTDTNLKIRLGVHGQLSSTVKTTGVNQGCTFRPHCFLIYI